MPKIAIAQINPIVGDLTGNKKKIIEYISKAEKAKADVVIFPELALCGYPPEDLLLKDHFVKDNVKALKDIVKNVNRLTAVIGFVDISKDNKIYNAAAIIQNKKIKFIYHKRGLPNYGVFDEKRYFTPGNEKAFTFKIKDVRFAVNICEDIWIENGIFLDQSKKGAEVIINISSSPYDVGKFKQRQALLIKRARQTKSYICYANLVGGQDELVFDGNSMVISPKGKMIALGKHCEEDLVLCDLLSQKAALKGEELSRIERIYKTLILGTRDYIQKNNFKKVVIGLSGGIDSSLVATIAVEAIGKENVMGVSMPSRYSSQGTQSDAKKIAKSLGIEFKVIPIEGIFDSYLKCLKEEFSSTKEDITEENIQARIRGNILMALSNKFRWLVLTTGNKSEVAVGYCTLYGDMSGGFAVIKDVPKTVVYELARFINKDKEIIPQSIIERPPTAELRHDQKDQDSLPPYDVLDKYLHSYVEEHKSFQQISNNGDEDIIKKVIKMVDYSEYKRRQAPPGIKITTRAFGRDWRLPITNKYKEF